MSVACCGLDERASPPAAAGRTARRRAGRASAAATVELRATFVAAGGHVYVGLAPLEPGDSQ